MAERLVVLLAGRIAGHLELERDGRPRFTYAPAWRQDRNAYPLSLSMPLAREEHPARIVEPWLWNLLPDNENTIERIARAFGVSRNSPYRILEQKGEDLAGAAQIVGEERARELLTGITVEEEVEWLTESEVAEELRRVKGDAASTRLSRTSGQFSLAGAQPKTALFYREGRWGIPKGRTPTTHILKPPTGDWEGFVENEHFCLTLARRLGLQACRSEVCRFEDQVAITVERYDRLWSDGRYLRVHQEDLCQAIGVHPRLKYENDGGPGVVEVVEALHAFSSSSEEDITTFLDAIALNWLIAGTDGHAKNYSLLIGTGGRARLAPLYDIASFWPYANHRNEMKLAMRVGREYVVGQIHLAEWEQLAKWVHRSVAEVVGRARQIAERLPAELEATRSELNEVGLVHPVIEQIVNRTTEWARREAGVLAF